MGDSEYGCWVREMIEAMLREQGQRFSLKEFYEYIDELERTYPESRRMREAFEHQLLALLDDDADLAVVDGEIRPVDD